MYLIMSPVYLEWHSNFFFNTVLYFFNFFFFFYIIYYIFKFASSSKAFDVAWLLLAPLSQHRRRTQQVHRLKNFLLLLHPCFPTGQGRGRQDEKGVAVRM